MGGDAASTAAPNPHSEEHETPAVLPKRQPDQPTQAEREAHEVTHAPYRSWCRACVAGRGRSDPHFKLDQAESSISTVAIDYAYLCEEGAEERASPILVARNDKTKIMDAEVLPSKGTLHDYNVTALTRIYEVCGFSRFMAKSDGEPAILDLKRRAIAAASSQHGKDIEPIESPKAESQCNGFIENGVREMKGMARTIKFATEELHDTKVSQSHPCLPWLVRHSAAMINIGQRGPDGRTAYERQRGKPFRSQIPSFSEKVLWLPAGKRKSTLDIKWQVGIYLGIVRRSDESFIGTPDGVVKARSVKRLSREERSDAALFNAIRGSPWQPTPGKDSLEVPVRIQLPHVVDTSSLPPKPVEIARNRAVYIRKPIELQKYGYTDGCAGCRAAREDTAPRPHSQACRTRIEEAMARDDAGQARLTEAFLRQTADVANTARATPAVTGNEASSTTPADAANVVAAPADTSGDTPMTDDAGSPMHAQAVKRTAADAQLEDRPDAAQMDLAVLAAWHRELVSKGLVGALDAGPHVDEPEPLQLHPEWYEEIYDNISGQRLDPALVAKGRQSEMKFMSDLGVWSYDTVQNCLETTGRQPLTVGWVDVNKGDSDNPDVRGRLSVQETKWQTTINADDVAATFAATPPYEALRFLLSCWMTPQTAEQGEYVAVFIDISRAHPHAGIRQDLWIRLSLEDPRTSEPGICGKLNNCLYGIKDAS